jgi:hypothetical protein
MNTIQRTFYRKVSQQHSSLAVTLPKEYTSAEYITAGTTMSMHILDMDNGDNVLLLRREK